MPQVNECNIESGSSVCVYVSSKQYTHLWVKQKLTCEVEYYNRSFLEAAWVQLFVEIEWSGRARKDKLRIWHKHCNATRINGSRSNTRCKGRYSSINMTTTYSVHIVRVHTINCFGRIFPLSECISFEEFSLPHPPSPNDNWCPPLRECVHNWKA